MQQYLIKLIRVIDLQMLHYLSTLLLLESRYKYLIKIEFYLLVLIKVLLGRKISFISQIQEPVE